MKHVRSLLLFSLLIGYSASAKIEGGDVTGANTAEPAQNTQAASVDIEKCTTGHCNDNVKTQPDQTDAPKVIGAKVASDLGSGTQDGSGPAGSSK